MYIAQCKICTSVECQTFAVREQVFARVSPDQKELILRTLRHVGWTTLMCGDGTNDVGALKTAHVGVALLTPRPKEASSRAKDARENNGRATAAASAAASAAAAGPAGSSGRAQPGRGGAAGPGPSSLSAGRGRRWPAAPASPPSV